MRASPLVRSSRSLGTSSGSAGGDRCSSTKPAVSSALPHLPLTTPSDEQEQSGVRPTRARRRIPPAVRLRMERDSGSVTAAFHGCRSAVAAACAPADAWSSSEAGASCASHETTASRRKGAVGSARCRWTCQQEANPARPRAQPSSRPASDGGSTVCNRDARVLPRASPAHIHNRLVVGRSASCAGPWLMSRRYLPPLSHREAQEARVRIAGSPC